MDWNMHARREVRIYAKCRYEFNEAINDQIETLIKDIEIQLHRGLDPTTAAAVEATLAEIRDLTVEVVTEARARVQAEFAEREAAAQAKADDQAVAAANGERVA